MVGGGGCAGTDIECSEHFVLLVKEVFELLTKEVYHNKVLQCQYHVTYNAGMQLRNIGSNWFNRLMLFLL